MEKRVKLGKYSTCGQAREYRKSGRSIRRWTRNIPNPTGGETEGYEEERRPGRE